MTNLSRRTLMSVAALAALAPAANSAFALDPAKNTKDMPMRNQKFALTREETLDVIRRTDHAVLSLADGTGEPYGVPITPILLDGKIYFHGAGMGDGRRNADIQQNPRGSICWIAQDRTNQPKLSVDFVSAIASGPIRIIKDKAEKTAIMRKILERHTPSVDINKEMNVRLEKIDKYTNVFEMKIEHLTGKAKDLGYLRFFGHNRPAQK